ncbi:MAG TPA: hypothetical protein VLB44_00395 [Kofleriaceae bacterium]|nr:hypothetical protein [Kofleriaceae bacterium]
MSAFAARTAAGKRYLWTDAFAVCNYLALGDVAAAIALVDQVHHVLGRFDARTGRIGWLSGLDDRAGEAHPTAGGLRIGKPLAERGPNDAYDKHLEWDRDGQYFHYLTKWMHALDRVAAATGHRQYADWARELAEVTVRKFEHDGRLYWKMSTDLSRPLVTSMGQHDALDGYVTCRQLAASNGSFSREPRAPELAATTEMLRDMIPAHRLDLATADPLGIGGLLLDAQRLSVLHDTELVEALLHACLASLRAFVRVTNLRGNADSRLGFRELGLALGLAALESIHPDSADTRYLLGELDAFRPLRASIEAFWLRPEHRARRSWLAHVDINDVMLATCLVPEGFLLHAPGAVGSSRGAGSITG